MNIFIEMFKWVILSSCMGSVLIILILFFKKILKNKINGIFHYYIWVLLFIRLLVPYVPHSSVSIFNLFSLVPKAYVDNYKQDFNNNNSTMDIKRVKMDGKASIDKKDKSSVINNKRKTVNSVHKGAYSSAIIYLTFFWSIIAAACLIYIIMSNLRFSKRIRKDYWKNNNKNIEEVYDNCKAIMKVKRNIPIFITREVRSPAIWGAIYPKLLIPKTLLDKISDEELKYILLHELAHYKKKDIILEWLTVIIKAIHWFNPVIWYAFYHMRQDCETACDAFVMLHVEPDEQIGYGRTILHLIELNSLQKVTAGVAGILSTSSKFELKRRIVMISNFKKISYKQIVASILIIVFICITGLTGGQQVSASAITKLATTSIMPKDRDSVARLWAEALAQRNEAFRFAVLNTDLRNKEYKVYKNTYWVIGGSSPWVTSYSVKEKSKINDNTYKYEIDYILTDSTRTKYSSKEYIEMKYYGDRWLVSKHDKYNMLPKFKLIKGAKFKKVTLPKANELITTDREKTVKLWAEALKERDGAMRLPLLNGNLKKLECKKREDKGWVIGGSSPWVTDYTTKLDKKIDKSTYEYVIDYNLTDSTNEKYTSSEKVTIKKVGDNWLISKHDNYDYMPDVTPQK